MSRPGDDVHAERLPELRDAEADRPQADDADIFPASSKPRKPRYSKRPARVNSSASKRRRPSASSAPNVNSATDCVAAAGPCHRSPAPRRPRRRCGSSRPCAWRRVAAREAPEHGRVDPRVRVERDEHARPRGAGDDLVVSGGPKLCAWVSSPLSRARSGSSSGSRSTKRRRPSGCGCRVRGRRISALVRLPWPAERGAPLGAPAPAGAR